MNILISGAKRFSKIIVFLAALWLLGLIANAAGLSINSMGTDFSNFAPRAPQSNAGRKGNRHSVTLHWDASASVVGYNVYRSDKPGGPYKKLNTQPISRTSYRDSTVRAGRNYYYIVKAVTSTKEESIASKEISAVIPAE